MHTSKKYNHFRRCTLAMVLSLLALGCTNLYSPLGMRQGDSKDDISDEEIDLSQLSSKTKRTLARIKERTSHHHKQAKVAQQKAEKAQKELKEKKQKLTKEFVDLQLSLANNMLKLGVPVEKVAATTGLSSLSMRSRLLQEIRAADLSSLGMRNKLLKEIRAAGRIKKKKL